MSSQPPDQSRVHRFTLPNGLRGVVVPIPHLHSVELAVYFQVGSRNDPPDRAGLSHLLEHILFRGCDRYPTTLSLETAFEEIGGSVNAATDEESTCYFSRVHPERIERGVELLSAMIRYPLFTHLETEKRIVVEEALEDLNERGEDINPHTIASRIFWGGTGLGRPTTGTVESIERVTLEDLRRHADRFYHPGNAVIVATGRVDPAAFQRGVERYLGDWESLSPEPDLPSPLPPPFRGPAVEVVRDSDSQVHLLVSFLSIPRHDRRLPQLKLLRRILAGGGSSRLHLRLREELGVIYSVDATLSAYRETGSFGIELFTAAEHLPLVLSTLSHELLRLVCDPFPPDELERVKRNMGYDLDFSVDSAYEMQTRYGWGELMGIDAGLESERREVDRITPGMVVALAREIFVPEGVAVVLVGPVSEGMEETVREIIATRFLRGG